MLFHDDKILRIKEFIKSPIGAGLSLVIILVLIGLIVATIIGTDGGKYDEDYYWFAEMDPASGREIWFGSPTNGKAVDPVRYVGFDKSLIDNGVTPEQYLIFRSAIEKYAEENGIELSRVSYLKDSYSLKASYVFDFKIVLNIDQKTLHIILDSSTGWKNILGASVTIMDENGEELYKLVVDETNLCDYQTPCELIDDGV